MAKGRSKYSVVPDGAARSVAGPSEGWADVTTSTTAESIDLSIYAGMYVEIQVEDQAHYVAFVESAATALATGAAGTVSSGALTAAAAAVPRKIPADGSIHRVVPAGAPILKYATLTGTGKIRVLRS